MSEPYEEIIQGESLVRAAPGTRHEAVCQRLHARVAESLQTVAVTRLLAWRAAVQLTPGSLVRPDLTLVTAATNKPWLIAEVVNSGDHHPDTVLKKNLYEEARLPRLWMVDPRYDNVEIYHGSPYGLVLKQILAGREVLTEGLLPALSVTMADLFAV